jgi:restriction system protein
MPRKLTSQIALGRVVGPYRYQRIGDSMRHTRDVKWERPDVPRTAFEQDLLHSFGAFMTVCNISRNDAERRVISVFSGKDDPGPNHYAGQGQEGGRRVRRRPNQKKYRILVNSLTTRSSRTSRPASLATRSRHLWMPCYRPTAGVTKISPPGADAGGDILGGRGPLGLDQPRVCVQVKSQNSPVDVSVYRTLQGSMQSYKAEQGLLVSWGGFNKVVLTEARQGHFTVRLWDSRDLVEAIYRTYEHLPAEIQADLPLKRAWMLVPDDVDA